MTEQPQKRPLFCLGQILATPGAIEALVEAKQMPDELLTRHITGDWGGAPFGDIGNCDGIAIR
jgi:hypothetical protein